MAKPSWSNEVHFISQNLLKIFIYYTCLLHVKNDKMHDKYKRNLLDLKHELKIVYFYNCGTILIKSPIPRLHGFWSTPKGMQNTLYINVYSNGEKNCLSFIISSFTNMPLIPFIILPALHDHRCTFFIQASIHIFLKRMHFDWKKSGLQPYIYLYNYILWVHIKSDSTLIPLKLSFKSKLLKP